MKRFKNVRWTLGLGLCLLLLAGCRAASEPAPIPYERYLAEDLFLAGFRETHATIYTLCNTLVDVDDSEDMLILWGQTGMALERAPYDRYQYHLFHTRYTEEKELLLPEALQEAFERYYTMYFSFLDKVRVLAENEEACPPDLQDATEILLETLQEDVPDPFRQQLATKPEEQARCNDYLNGVSAALQKVLDEIPAREDAAP